MSVRSKPEASVLSVGTTQAAVRAATESTATMAATFQTGGRGGASDGSGARLASSLAETSPAPSPIAIVATRTVNSWNQPKVPRISLIQTSVVTPRTISARRAGAPDQPGSSTARTRYAPNASAASDREQLDRPDQVVAGGQDPLACGRRDEGDRRAHRHAARVPASRSAASEAGS